MSGEAHADDCECSSCGTTVMTVVCRKCRTTVKLRKRYAGDPDWFTCGGCQNSGLKSLRD